MQHSEYSPYFYRMRAVFRANIVLSLLGQQQQFHFAFGQRPFPFATSDPLSGFRMPPIGNCQSKFIVASHLQDLHGYLLVCSCQCRIFNTYIFSIFKELINTNVLFLGFNINTILQHI